VNLDLRRRPAAGEKGEDARNGCDDDMATQSYPRENSRVLVTMALSAVVVIRARISSLCLVYNSNSVPATWRSRDAVRLEILAWKINIMPSLFI